MTKKRPASAVSSTMRSVHPILLLSLCLVSVATGFVPAGRSPAASTAARPSSRTHHDKKSRSQQVLRHVSSSLLSVVADNNILAAASSWWWIATIDSDIAKIPDNEFAPVFLGGMAVMLGGVLSAAFVGTVVDQKNLYGQLVVDSYSPDRNDEAFWKGLNEEERLKVKDLLERMALGKDDAKQELEEMMAQKMAAINSSSSGTTTSNINNPEGSAAVDKQTLPSDSTKANAEASKKQKKEIGMFSDYAE
jgi:hypothetical protein